MMEGLKANTSSYAVVAALFATVTYAAHVTPPGGFDSTGAHAAKSAAFVVFFYSNFLAFWFALGLLAAVLTLTAGIDSNPDVIPEYSSSKKAAGGDYERWNEMALWLQGLAIPMYVCAGVAMIAAGYVSQEETHAHLSILAAGLVILYTGFLVMVMSREWGVYKAGLCCITCTDNPFACCGSKA